MNEPNVMLEMLGGREGLEADPRMAAARGPVRTIAVVGLSDNPAKPSYSVSAYMQSQGYRVVPVNPAIPSALGEASYPSLRALGFRPDVVNVFRLPQFISGVVDEMIELGLENLWVQLGIRNPEAAAKAEAAGIRVVMDRCILIEHRRLLREMAAA